MPFCWFCHDAGHSYVLMFRSSKTHIFRHGVRIPVYSNHQMMEHTKLRRCAGAVDSDPLFVTEKKASFCVDVFYFKHPRHSQLFAVRFLEVSWTPYCSRNNIPDHLFKTLGWWSSDCYTRYIHNDEDSIIRTDEDSIRNAQIKIMRTASSEFGTYSLCEQRRFGRACASAQSRQNLRCSIKQAVSREEPSDRKPVPWPLWMAGHAQLKFVMTEC